MGQFEDWGRLEGPVVAFNGPCSNLRAVEALRSLDLGTPLCLGDACAYAAEPEETVRALRGWGVRSIAGNCEDSLGHRQDDCGCGFGDGTSCDLLARQWFAHADRALSEESRIWMRDVPRFARFTQAGRSFGLLHGGARAVNRFLWPVSSDAELQAEHEALEEVLGQLDVVLAGHSGVPFRRRVGRFEWVNLGALGLPPNDGDPRTCYATIARGEVALYRLPYDHEAAAAAMEAAGVGGYAEAVRAGLWPSEEVLPPVMRRAPSPADAAPAPAP